MKKLSRLLVVILILVSSLPIINFSSLNQSIRDEFNSQTELITVLKSCSSDYYRDQLTDEDEIELYDKIESLMFYCLSESPIFFTDDETVNKIALYVCLDNPFLNITNQYYETQGGDSGKSILEEYLGISYLPFTFTNDGYFEKMAQTYETALAIVQNMPLYSTDYEKAKYLHDYIVTSVRYTYDYSDTDADTAYGALLNHSARCEGYTDAYAILLKLAGIDSTKVMYFGSDADSAVGHIWNMVSIEGNWYHVDTTNDSFGTDLNIPADYTSYTFFLISTQDILKSYPINALISNSIPACDITTDNYFIKNGLYFTDYDRYTVGKAAGRFLRTQLSNGLNGVSIKFSNQSAYQKALSASEIPYLLSVISDYDGAYTNYYNYFYNDEQMVITFFTD